MTATLSPTFLADLAQVHATLRTHALSAAFLSDLEKVYATLPVASDATLLFLADRFHDWQRVTREFVSTRLAELAEDDPLLCPISLFRTMDSGRLEVAHTRTLAWLLDPAKNDEHGFGDALLGALLVRLADRAHFDRLQVTRVACEHSVDGCEEKGRLDVLAEGEWACAGEHVSWMLVIEAKVDAWEGDGQLEKYDEWLLAHAAGRVIYRVFLTPEGRPPEGGGDEWTALSFPHLVQIFRKAYPKLKTAPGFHFLRFYLAGVLQDICGWPRKVTANAPDPYAVAAYLKTVNDSHSEGASDDATR
jgi:hypothetical protein